MDSACNRGAEALAAGDGKRAAIEFMFALDHVAPVAAAFVGAGDAQMLLGDPESAAGAYRAAALLQPDEPSVALRLGRALDAAGQGAAAERVLRDMAERSDTPEVWWALYDVIGSDAPLSAQLTIVQRLAALEPQSPYSRALHGAVLLEQSVLPLAERFLMLAQQLAPQTVVLATALLQLYARSDRVIEARMCVETIRDSLRARSATVDDLASVAAALAALGERSLAMQALARARAIGADVPSSWSGILETWGEPRPVSYLLAWATRERIAAGVG